MVSKFAEAIKNKVSADYKAAKAEVWARKGVKLGAAYKVSTNARKSTGKKPTSKGGRKAK